MDNDILLYSLISLGGIGLGAAIILFFIAKKFKVIEDPKIDEIEELLPSANCGGCGYAGCRAFAEAIVKKNDLEGFNCPVGGNDLMKEIAPVLGVEAKESDPMIAVVRCFGTPENAPKKINYEGIGSCYYANLLSSGETGCPNGCLGLGDCVDSCQFDAIYIDPATHLPIIKNNCVACGACVTACPRDIIELRKKGKKDRRIYVQCVNEEKGGPAKKNCKVACIGCGKCVKVCKFDAIKLENNLAYIDFNKCTLCRKCPSECPTNAIVEINMPPRKPKKEVTETTTSN